MAGSALDSVLENLQSPSSDTVSQDVLDDVLQGLEPSPERPTLANLSRPKDGLTRVPGTGAEILQPAATLARVGLEAAGDLGMFAATRRLPLATGTRLARAGKRGVEALSAGLGTAAGSLAAESVDPTTDGDPFARAAFSGALSAVSDGVFSGLGDLVLAKLTGPGVVEPGAREIVSRFSGRGESLPTAGRLSKSRAVDVVETISESSLFGGKRIQDRLSRAELVGQGEIDNLVNDLLKGSSRADVSQLVSDLLSDRVDLFKETGADLYRLVDDAVAAEDVPFKVNIAPLFVIRERLERQITPEREGVERSIELLDEAIEKSQVSGTQRNLTDVPFSIAQELRSALIAVGQSKDPILRGGEAAARQLSGELDRQIDVAGASLSGGALQAFRDANQFWRNGRDALKNQAISSVLRAQNADHVIDLLVRPKGTQTVKQLRQALFGGLGDNVDIRSASDVISKARRVLSSSKSSAEAKALATKRIAAAENGQEAWEKLQGQVIVDAIRGSDRNAGISARQLFEEQKGFDASGTKKRLGSLTDETLREVFPDGRVRKNLETFIRQVEVSQSPAGRNIPGGIFVQLGQAGALVALLANPGDLTGPATILLGPLAAARLMDSDKAIRWLTIGTSKRASTTGRQRAFAQLAQIAIRNGARLINSDGEEINQSREPKFPSRPELDRSNRGVR